MARLLAYKHAIEALHDAPEVDGIIVHLFAGFGIWFLEHERNHGRYQRASETNPILADRPGERSRRPLE